MEQTKIIASLRSEIEEITETAGTFSEEFFYQRPTDNRWSAAENIEHLFVSVKPLVGLFGNPQIMIEKWGEHTKTSRNYDEIVAVYLEALKNSGPIAFNATPLAPEARMAEQIKKFDSIYEKFIERSALLSELDLETYQIPHPLIGFLTAGEFISFTLYHNRHHHKAIKNLLGAIKE